MYYYFVDVLRCIATILITNSHYNAIWPIAALATGGSLGNTLFFAISGYCLSNTQNTNFVEWMKKRVLRIYPAVWIVTLIEFAFLTPSIIHSIWDGVTYFIYPTQFWFVSASVLFYGLFYIIDKYLAKFANQSILRVCIPGQSYCSYDLNTGLCRDSPLYGESILIKSEREKK